MQPHFPEYATKLTYTDPQSLSWFPPLHLPFWTRATCVMILHLSSFIMIISRSVLLYRWISLTIRHFVLSEDLSIPYLIDANGIQCPNFHGILTSFSIGFIHFDYGDSEASSKEYLPILIDRLFLKRRRDLSTPLSLKNEKYLRS